MPDPKIQREQTSIKQLTSVSKVRQIRSQTERETLAEREQAMEQAWCSQRLDEDLLAQQQAHWASAWQALANPWGKPGMVAGDLYTAQLSLTPAQFFRFFSSVAVGKL